MRVPILINNKEHFIINNTSYAGFEVITEAANTKGEILKTMKGAFLTLHGTINWIVSQKVQQSDAATLQEIKDAIFKAKKEMLEIYNTEIVKISD